MDKIEFIFGLLGSITAASLFFPQVWASYKTKRTHDLSWFGIGLGMLNGSFWIVYGLLQADPFIWVTNMICFLGAFFLLVLKRKYD